MANFNQAPLGQAAVNDLFAHSLDLTTGSNTFGSLVEATLYFWPYYQDPVQAINSSLSFGPVAITIIGGGSSFPSTGQQWPLNV